LYFIFLKCLIIKNAGTAIVAYPTRFAHSRKIQISSKFEFETETWIGGAKTYFIKVELQIIEYNNNIAV